jgi:hypothetical protein
MSTGTLAEKGQTRICVTATMSNSNLFVPSKFSSWHLPDTACCRCLSIVPFCSGYTSIYCADHYHWFKLTLAPKTYNRIQILGSPLIWTQLDSQCKPQFLLNYMELYGQCVQQYNEGQSLYLGCAVVVST